jgi:flagellar basal body-associated protein FliL
MKLKKWHKIVLVMLAVAGIAGFVVWKVINKKNPSLKNVTPDYTVTMNGLIQEFSANDSAAQQKYLGKVLEVSGTVKKLVNSDSAAVLNLGDTSSLSVVQCQIDARHNDGVKNIKEGDQVTVKGKLAGFTKQEAGDAVADLLGDTQAGTDVTLNFCVLVNKKQ